MAIIDKMFQLAAAAALKEGGSRTFYIGCAAKRSDGAIVVARNEASRVPIPSAHAEARVSKRLDHGATVYVVRLVKVKKRSPEFAMAKPCFTCQRFLRSRKVKRVYFTTGPCSWDFIDL